jgi:small acid-soluble spore protein F (minor alpha/beta-type SASP)
MCNWIFNSKNEEVLAVSRQRSSIMSDKLKTEIAKELGVYNTVETEGWGSVSSRNCGNIVRKAIEMAERNFEGK